jgi:hypothetical protein
MPKPRSPHRARPATAFWSVLVPALVFAQAALSMPLPDFIRALTLEYRAPFTAGEPGAFDSVCVEHGLDATDPTNRSLYHEIMFLHALFTGDGAGDGDRGGLLRIPYFWHWIDPNPRHGIRLVADDRPLVALPPPAPYTRYASQADIDRVPLLYLGDLVAERPRYRHPEYGTFETFGWCSEREMAFLALLLALGHEGKIVQDGIHVWTELWCELGAASGQRVAVTVRVDNTFGRVRWQAVPGGTDRARWLTQVGQGGQVAWYNRTARSSAQLNGLRRLEVGEAAATRIRTRVSEELARVP